MRALRIAAVTETLTLAVLLVNLATVHAETITSIGGPLHGTAYLVAIATARYTADSAGSGAVWRAIVPGVGGLLALHRIRHCAPASVPTPPDR